MKTLAFALLAALLVPGLAGAQSKEEDIDALVDAIRLEGRVAASNQLVRASFLRGLRSRGSNPRLRELFDEEYKRTFPADRLFAEVKPKVVEIFDAQFSHDEIRELTAMFRAPVYLKYRENNDDIGRAILAAIQTSVKAGMGDLMKRVTDRAMAEGVQK